METRNTKSSGRLKFALCLAFALTFAASAFPQSSPTPPAQASWTITDLGVLKDVNGNPSGDTGSHATAINASGTVVGYSGLYIDLLDGYAFYGFLNQDGFIWTPDSKNGTTGKLSYIGGLPGNYCFQPETMAGPFTTPSGYIQLDSVPYDINSSGQAVGYSFWSPDGTCPNADLHGALYQNGSVVDLGVPPQTVGVGNASFTDSLATSINDAGQIVGYSSVNGNETVYAWINDGTYHLLGNPPYPPILPYAFYISSPTKINNKETFVGDSYTSGLEVGFKHAGTGPFLATDVIGDLGGGQGGTANGVNDSEMVVGNASVNLNGNLTFHALFLDKQGGAHDLGTLSKDPLSSSTAIAINNTSFNIVGASTIDPSQAWMACQHAVMWQNAGTIIDLNLLLDPKIQPPVGTPNSCSGELPSINVCATCWELISATGINDLGQIVGEGIINGEHHAFLLTPPCIADGGDTDNDGLCDNWEKNGYTDPKTGKFVDLPAMGADPMHKDIFVQTDYMVFEGGCGPTGTCVAGHSHQPSPDAIALVTAAFANAPVNNPDGTTGITLHVDCGISCVMNPLTGQTWGALSRANAMPENFTLGVSNCPVPPKGPQNCYNFTQFNTIANEQDQFGNANFPPSRGPIFHYALFAHDLDIECMDNTKHEAVICGITGISEGIPSSGFIVSLGSYFANVGTVWNQAGTFMHELGHNLGLHHGGLDETQWKPNYLSVMNYSFQFEGLIQGGINGLFDYSRFPSIPSLNEYALNETIGLNGGTDLADYGTAYYCPGADPVVVPGKSIGRRDVGDANGPIDWNCDGSIETSVKSDIAATDIPFVPGLPVILDTSEDWNHLVFAGGAIGMGAMGGSGFAFGNPANPFDIESPVADDPEAPYLVTVASVSPGSALVSPGSSLNVVFTVSNAGLQPDTYSITTTSTSSDWWDTTATPAAISLAGGASQQITIPLQVSACLSTGTQGTFTLKAVSQMHPTIMDSSFAQLTVLPSPPGSVAIPNVVGLPQADAQAAITSAGLIVGTQSTQSSSTVPAGVVISQAPATCALTTPGSAISLVVSTGPSFVAMPNVVGDTQAAASTAITSAGLALDSVSTTASSTVPAGIVISESPAAGANVLVGSSAGILVSSGASSSNVVPNVVGQSVGAADTTIVGAGLVVGTTTGSISSSVTAGTVISETPAAGTSVTPGASVNLTVSVGSSSYTVVPSVLGETPAQASSAITSAGLILGGDFYYSSTTVPAGQVFEQSPLAGTFTSTGTLVYLGISVGLANTVPNLYGLSQAAATSALAAVGLNVGVVSPYPSGTTPKGEVFGQSPAPGYYATAGSTVNLTVSSGVPSYTVPDLSNTYAGLGAQAITAAGLTLGTFTTALSSTVSQGLFISQSPAAGTVVAPGSPVNAVYSAGSHLYPIPDVVGEGQDLAIGSIRNAYFYVALTREASTTVPDGVVISQIPAGGGQALIGSVITLVVSSGGAVMSTVPNTLYDPNAIPYGTVGTLDQAFQAIYAAGFAVGSVTTQLSDTSIPVPANYVISQSPAPGTQAPWGTSVSLVISEGGGYPATIPNLVGMSQAAAINTLQNAPVPPLLQGDAFWNYTLTTQSSTTVPAGNVISQNPPPGMAIVPAPYQQQVGYSAYVLGPVNFVVSAGPSTVPSYSYLSQFGSSGGPYAQDGQGPLYALAIDPVSRNIIVTGLDGRVQIFDSNGNFKSYFGGYGLNQYIDTNVSPGQIFDFEGPVGNGLFIVQGPSAIAVDPVNHNILVADLYAQRIMIFNSAGVFQSEFGTPGFETGQFAFGSFPGSGIAVDPVTENILVADTGNSRVQIFNSAGVYQAQFGTLGSGYAQFLYPSAIAIDPSTRNIVVADWGNNRIETFNSAGGYLSQFGGLAAGNGTFYEPTAIAIDPATHNIAVGYGGLPGAKPNPYIQIFSFTGAYLSEFGGIGTANGQIGGQPSGLAFDPISHNLVVSDGSRVQIFGVATSVSGSTTTTLVPSSNPVGFGQSVTFTATVTGSRPTGTVQFLDGATSLGTPVTLTAGVAALSTSTLAVGPHSITGVYSGDSSNPGSTSAAVSEVVSPSASTTTLAASANSVTAGQSVTFTATVTGTSPTGTVEFLNGFGSLSPAVPLTSGVATFTTSSLPVGTDSITAVYSGDANNATSTSAALSEVVTLAASNTALSASANHVTFGQPVTLIAVISGDSPTGTVQFLDNGTSLGAPVALIGTVASLTLSTLSAGTHPITAVYSGDKYNATSTSPILNELISLNGATTTIVGASVNPATIGQLVTFTASVKGTSAVTGTVQFMDGSAILGSPIALTAGVASFATLSLTVGTHSITAAYSGDASNAASDSAALSEVVSPNATATSVTSSANPAIVGQPVTFTASVTGSNPSGPILFLDGATPLVTLTGSTGLSGKINAAGANPLSISLINGQASVTLSSLTAGTHSITAVYHGDSVNAASTSAILSQVIHSAAAPPVVTPPASISIPATQANGATSSAWPALAVFLAGATATSTLPAAPVQLAPQVGGLAVTGSTLFPIGTTTVTFSFKDANGNVGTATSTVTVAVGVFRITGSVSGVGTDPSGATYFNIVLTNTGTGNAENLQIKTLQFRAVGGTGTVTYNTALSPTLPVTIGTLNVGASVTTKFYLNVPSTVTRIGLAESGPAQDVLGNNYTYSTAQITAP